jgi:hypothetical protein
MAKRLVWTWFIKIFGLIKREKKQPNLIYDGNGLLFYFNLFYGYFNSLPSANQKCLEQKKFKKTLTLSLALALLD